MLIIVDHRQSREGRLVRSTSDFNSEGMAWQLNSDGRPSVWAGVRGGPSVWAPFAHPIAIFRPISRDFALI